MVDYQSTPAHRPTFCWGCKTDTHMVDAKLQPLLILYANLGAWKNRLFSTSLTNEYRLSLRIRRAVCVRYAAELRPAGHSLARLADMTAGRQHVYAHLDDVGISRLRERHK